jgi:hypothetical protein
MRVEWLNDNTIALLASGICPDCGHRGYLMGPRGGASTNIECGNQHCAARFNVVQYPASHRIAAGHRIPKEAEGGSKW